MNTEGNLWKVAWTKRRNGYALCLSDNPNFKETAKTIEEAIEQLEDRIADELGDAVPHLEFVRPLPHPLAIEGCDFIYTLGAHYRIDVKNPEGLFKKPRCLSCQNLSGPRNDELIHLGAPPPGRIGLYRIRRNRLCSFS